MKPGIVIPLFKDSASPSLTPFTGPLCELLFDLFEGDQGRVHLARMLTGHDAGRLVTLRKLSGAPSPDLTSAVDLARSVAHPKLAKVLGTLRAGDSWHVASEYTPGITLFELGQATVNLRERVDPTVAVRIVLDLLNAAVAAKRLLGQSGNVSSVRCVYPESVWIADFGETLLSEVQVSAVLAQLTPTAAREPRSSFPALPDYDVHAAGVALIELACGSSAVDALDNPNIPNWLRDIAARATGFAGVARYPSVREFADDCADLHPSSIASEEEVGLELRRIMGSVLDIRRQKLSMTERVSLQEGGEDDTKFFRAAGASTQHDTARPPAGAEAYSTKYRIPTRPEVPVEVPVDAPDEPTMVFRPSRAKRDSAPELVPPNDLTQRLSADWLSEQAAANATAGTLPLAPLDPAPTRVVTAPRLIAVLVLLLAVLAFGLTSGDPSPSASGQGASAAYTSLNWLKVQTNKIARWLR